MAKDVNFQPDIIHSNDWQTALISPYLKIHYLNDPFFFNTASVFSIHNIGYQGTFTRDSYEFLGLGWDNYNESKFENYDGINFMKGAIFYADCINTVSPTYSKEILTDVGGNGLAPYLERRRDDLFGILNGADYEHWNPETDKLIQLDILRMICPEKPYAKRQCKKNFG